MKKGIIIYLCVAVMASICYAKKPETNEKKTKSNATSSVQPPKTQAETIDTVKPEVDELQLLRDEMNLQISEKDSIIQTLENSNKELNKRLEKAESRLKKLDDYIGKIESEIYATATDMRTSSLEKMDAAKMQKTAEDYKPKRAIVSLINADTDAKLASIADSLNKVAPIATMAQRAVQLMKAAPASATEMQLSADLTKCDKRLLNSEQRKEAEAIADALKYHADAHNNICQIIKSLKEEIVVIPEESDATPTLQWVMMYIKESKGLAENAERYNDYYTTINNVFDELTEKLKNFKANEKMLSGEVSFAKWLDSLSNRLITPANK